MGYLLIPIDFIVPWIGILPRVSGSQGKSLRDSSTFVHHALKLFKARWLAISLGFKFSWQLCKKDVARQVIQSVDVLLGKKLLKLIDVLHGIMKS